jgi:anthranilate phosphoribosyltransferase
MKYTEESLRDFGTIIGRLMSGDDLSREDCRDGFAELLLDRQPALQQGAFLAALKAKGETAEELAGAWEAIAAHDTVRVELPRGLKVCENSGTGMDRIKTFNASTAASLVAAAGGVPMARHGSRALTSTCGTVDILESLGVPVELAPEEAARSLESAGITLFNGMSERVHPRALFRILSRIRFGSTLNIAASLASPCSPSWGVRGVYDPSLVPTVVELMEGIGYERSIVLHGFDDEGTPGVDEVSLEGATLVMEKRAGRESDRFTLYPEDFGIARRSLNEVRSLPSLKAERDRFLKVVAGKGAPGPTDFTVVNAAVIFVCAGLDADYIGGAKRARDILSGGKALKTLAGWVASGHDEGMAILETAAREAGCEEELAGAVG